MTKKTKKRCTEEQKEAAINDYISGARSAKEIASDLDIDVQNIYRWRTLRGEEEKNLRVDDLIFEGNSKDQARRILQLEMEIEAYQKKVAEQVVMLDLLKKSRGLSSSRQESELTGLLETTKRLDQKRKRAK